MPSPQLDSGFQFVPRGAAIQSIVVGGHNIVLGFPTAELYSKIAHPHFGETVGRCTNRIKDAKLSNLNGKTYDLEKNNGEHNLHGGSQGWGKRFWEGPEKCERNGREAIKFTHLSKDGDEGFPGNVEARVWYFETVSKGSEKLELEFEYEAEMLQDQPEGVEETVVGMTNHSYFNLNPDSPSIAGTEVTLATTQYQEITPEGIPTGAIKTFPDIPDTPNTKFTLGETHPDPDDCFVMNTDAASIPLDTRPLELKTLATFYHPATKVHLEVSSTEPAFQFYAGRFVDVEAVEQDGIKVPARGKRGGFCVEPSRYVDCAGREEWRGMCLLKKGQVWGAKNKYVTWVE